MMPREDENGWRTIESAPNANSKDEIIIWNSRYPEEKPKARLPDGEWWRANRDSKSVPTHWCPFPEPPHDR